ncbi:hypothetical protein Pint_22657 [Pistacia integerrima]|uniref:Uncharacterized protein n=1 Tax=Pistacia integerrima TaxID=434235 RepID=A0ACC0YGJ9_9ROSI|nr:hypothetical protein Pint_22657 [Pistacia integerrima]
MKATSVLNFLCLRSTISQRKHVVNSASMLNLKILWLLDPLYGNLSPEGSAVLHFRRLSPSASIGIISCKFNSLAFNTNTRGIFSNHKNNLIQACCPVATLQAHGSSLMFSMYVVHSLDILKVYHCKEDEVCLYESRLFEVPFHNEVPDSTPAEITPAYAIKPKISTTGLQLPAAVS